MPRPRRRLKLSHRKKGVNFKKKQSQKQSNNEEKHKDSEFNANEVSDDSSSEELPLVYLTKEVVINGHPKRPRKKHKLKKRKKSTDSWSNDVFLSCYYSGCSFKTEYDFSLDHHISNHLEEQKKPLFDCSQSDAIETYTCSECDFRTHLKVAINYHKNVHMLSVDSTGVCLNNQMCVLCGFDTFSLLVFARHSSVEHSDSPDKELSKNFRCSQCTLETSSHWLLKLHIIKEHCVENEASVYKCPGCPVKAESKKSLEGHITSQHLDKTNLQTWHRCPNLDCSYRTQFKSSVEKHIQAHFTKELKCSECDYKSLSKKKILRHLADEHGLGDGEWFYCGCCPYRSHSERHLGVHVKGAHYSLENVRWRKCEDCNNEVELVCLD